MARPIPPDDHEVLSDFAGALLPGGLRFIEVWRAGAETVMQGPQSTADDPQCLRGGSSQANVPQCVTGARVPCSGSAW